MGKESASQGFSTWLTTTKMTVRMHLHMALFFLLIQLGISLAMSWYFYGYRWENLARYMWLSFIKFRPPAQAEEMAIDLIRDNTWIIAYTSLIWAFYPLVVGKFKLRALKQSGDNYLRGARLITPKKLRKRISKDGEAVDIPLGPIQIPRSSEIKHFFVVGRPGVGKTVAMSNVIARVKERGAKGVIYDFKGDYLSRFFDPERDILFNPLDARCQGWNLFSEISTYMDIDAIAHSLIPQAYMSEPFWNEGARDVFAGLMHYLYQQGKRTNRDIWEAVTAPARDIAGWLRATKGGERGYRYIEDASSKQAMSILAVMMQYTKSFEFMAGLFDGDFSVTKWLENESPSFIFLVNYSDVKDTLKPVLSLFVDLLGRKLLSLNDDYNRRIFFFLDEFGTIQRLSSIIQLLTLSRSKGGSCWIGIQDIGQLDKIYTEQLRQAIVNACGGNLIFSVSDPVTARFLAEKIGETEYAETEETQSLGASKKKEGISLVRHKKTEKLVLPSDIECLRDLECYLKLPNYDFTVIKLEYRSFDNLHPSFIIRPELNM